MAPTKTTAASKKRAASSSVDRRVTRSAAIANRRVTRSASKNGRAHLVNGFTEEQFKKRKNAPAKGESSRRGKGKAKTTSDDQEKDEPAASAAASAAPYAIVIEASKEAKSFQKAAKDIKSALCTAFPSISVEMVRKPRKGCFEIRDEKGGIFLQHLDLEKPYTELETVDVPKLVEDVGKKIS